MFFIMVDALLFSFFQFPLAQHNMFISEVFVGGNIFSNMISEVPLDKSQRWNPGTKLILELVNRILL